MRQTVEINSVYITLFACYYKKVGYADLKSKKVTTSKQRMATYSLLIGILVIIISWKIYKDWASGIAGFIYGGIIFWSINLFVQLIKALIR